MMGSAERRQREKENLRAAILDAARELFISDGYEAVTMRKIAERIEYSPTAIYQYFADKESLVTELCAEDFLTLAASMQHLVGRADVIERLRGIAEAYVGFARAYPNHYRFMFMTEHPNQSEAKYGERRGNPAQDSYALLRITLAQAIAEDRLVPSLTDPDLACQVAWGAIHGVIALQLAMCKDTWVEWQPLDKVCAAAIDTLIRGMARPA